MDNVDAPFSSMSSCRARLPSDICFADLGIMTYYGDVLPFIVGGQLKRLGVSF